ncbi:MAG: DUF2852 domain-containing protein [Pseudomonadota bacterium]|jgi:hypothetical protein|nr:hypothetical protein [Alphaproteobacteria bacterium]
MDQMIAKLDEMGKGAWIGLMVLSFVLFWPVGLALLAFMIWSGRMGHKCRMRQHRFQENWTTDKGGRPWAWRRAQNAGSGNSAFDEYRAETLRRLEQEQEEFMSFLERLRFARDKAEFDQFLDERRQSAQTRDTQPEAQA